MLWLIIGAGTMAFIVLVSYLLYRAVPEPDTRGRRARKGSHAPADGGSDSDSWWDWSDSSSGDSGGDSGGGGGGSD